ncbi:MAG: hypothetical protein AVDCRST_MAG57-705, partial [uncultured Blastococcus sp.]
DGQRRPPCRLGRSPADAAGLRRTGGDRGGRHALRRRGAQGDDEHRRPLWHRRPGGDGRHRAGDRRGLPLPRPVAGGRRCRRHLLPQHRPWPCPALDGGPGGGLRAEVALGLAGPREQRRGRAAGHPGGRRRARGRRGRGAARPACRGPRERPEEAAAAVL